jgi:hypothetical protein
MGALRLVILWGALTGVYLAAVIYRVVVLHEPVGLPTYAGFSAVAAVWFSLLDAVHPREALRIGAIASLGASIIANAAIISRAFVASRGTPVLRILFTLLLLIALLNSTLQFPHHRTHKDKE